MKLFVNIELGNDAMKTAEDLAQAVEYIANRIRAAYDSAPIQAICNGRVKDDNGNRVGTWGIN